jgi:hypothetical protein
MFSSDAEVNLIRTPCQHLRDLADRSGEATDVTGERRAVCDQVLDFIAEKLISISLCGCSDANSGREDGGGFNPACFDYRTQDADHSYSGLRPLPR